MINTAHAMDRHGSQIVIHSNTLIPNEDPLFMETVSEINRWLGEYFANKPRKELKKALSGFKTHAFLYRYAGSLANIEEANFKVLEKKLETVWKDKENIRSPQTEEMIFGMDEMIKNMNNFYNFQKVNRLLFDDYDNELHNLFK